MLSWGLVLVEKEGWLAKEERHDKVADKVAAVPVCVCVAVVCSFCGVCGRGVRAWFAAVRSQLLSTATLPLCFPLCIALI